MSKADTSTTVEQPVEHDFDQLEERILEVLDDTYEIRNVQHMESADRVTVWLDTGILYQHTIKRIIEEFGDEKIKISVGMMGNTICQKLTVYL